MRSRWRSTQVDIVADLPAVGDAGIEGSPPAAEQAGQPASVGDTGEEQAALSDGPVPPEPIVEITALAIVPEAENAAAVATAVAMSDAGVEAIPEPPAGVTIEPDIAAETDARAQPVGGRVPWWPFLVYFAAWLAVSGVATWLLLQTPPGEAVYATELYRGMVLAGLALTAAGPCLIVAVWLASVLRTPGESHAGLFTSSLLKGALATLGGVAVWWAALVMIDMLRLGRPM